MVSGTRSMLTLGSAGGAASSPAHSSHECRAVSLMDARPGISQSNVEQEEGAEGSSMSTSSPSNGSSTAFVFTCPTYACKACHTSTHSEKHRFQNSDGCRLQLV
eukprot:3550829-Rhodomonas_salina.1